MPLMAESITFYPEYSLAKYEREDFCFVFFPPFPLYYVFIAYGALGKMLRIQSKIVHHKNSQTWETGCKSSLT